MGVVGVMAMTPGGLFSQDFPTSDYTLPVLEQNAAPEPSVPSYIITDPAESAAPGITGDRFSDSPIPYPFSLNNPSGVSGGIPMVEIPEYSMCVTQTVEERFAHWDPSLKACIPGFGRELPTSDAPWKWQMMPQGILFRSYMASDKEAKMAVPFFHESKGNANYWDPALGGKMGLIRYGNFEKLYPEGIQVDIECAALARLTAGDEWEVFGTDYRFAATLTGRYGHWEGKTGYYHISSHRGDELMVRQGNLDRRNYVRDCLMFAVAFRPDANWRFYFELNVAVWTDSGAEPLQVEMGFEYSPIMMPNFKGSPFAAFHCRLSEDNNFGETLSLHLGWQWKSLYQQTFRTGLYFMSGYSDQYQFYNVRERQVGWGAWFDF